MIDPTTGRALHGRRARLSGKWLLPLLLLLAPAWAGAQQLILCAPGVPCSSGGPVNTGDGDNGPTGAIKINTNALAFQSAITANASAISTLNGIVTPIPAGDLWCNSGGSTAYPAACGTLPTSFLVGAVNGGTGERGTITGIPKANGTSAYTAAASSDVASLFTCFGSTTAFLRGDGACGTPGTVSSVSGVATNGFTWSIATSTTTPSITLGISIAGPLKGLSGAVAAASASDIGALWACGSTEVLQSNGTCLPSTTLTAAVVYDLFGCTGSATTYPNGAGGCTTPSGGGGDPNTTDLCTYSGVDASGATDSRAAVVNALAAVAGTNVTLWINCPVKLTIGTDYTKPIFVSSGTNLSFGPNGYFIVDNVLVSAFIFEDAANCKWLNTVIEYVATPGITAINYTTPGPGNPGSTQNDTTITNWLTANQGNTFSTGKAIWQGPTNAQAIIQIRGTSNNIQLIGGKAYVPQGASAANFIPTLFTVGPEWNPGLTGISSSTTATTANSSIPTNITIQGWTIDGYLMGIVGSVNNLIWEDITAFRYSDLQDGTSGTVTFSAGLSSGATSGSLSTSTYLTGWPYPTGTYALTLSNAQLIYVLLTQGQWTTGTFSSALSSSATASATSGNIGGVAGWMSPPHLEYIDDPMYTASAYMHRIRDLGPYVGIATRTSTTRGYLHSLKFADENYSEVDDYISLRPDGCAQLISTGFGNGKVKGLNCVSNSSLATANSGVAGQALIFPTTSVAYFNLVMDDITLTDTAAVPLGWPFPGIGASGMAGGIVNSDISITNLKVFVQDWPGTYNPGFGFEGTRFNVQAEAHFAACTSTQSGRGLVANTGTVTLSNSTLDYKVFGWRTLTTSNYTNNKQRVQGLTQLATNHNYAHILDASNSWEGTFSNGTMLEAWTQFWSGTPTGGTTFTTPIQFLSTMSVDHFTWQVTTNLDTTNGVTSVNAGYSGSATAFGSTLGITTSADPAFPLATVTPAGAALLLTAVGGTGFGTTGIAQIGARGSQIVGLN